MVAKSIKTYLYVYSLMFVQNIKVLGSYKFDLLFGVISLFLKNLSSLLFLYILFQNIQELQGYDFYTMLLLQGVASVGYGIWHFFFINTISLPYYITSGEFNYFINKPVQPIFLIMADGFDEDGLGDLLYGIVLITIALYSLSLSIWLIIPLVFVCFFSTLIFASISIIGSLVVFLSHGYMDLSTIVRELQSVAKYPISIFSTWLRVLFYTLVPIAYVAFVPTNLILNGKWFIYFPFLAVGSVLFFVCSCLLWNRASRWYQSPGS